MSTLAATTLNEAASARLTRCVATLLSVVETKIDQYNILKERIANGEISPGSLLDWNVDDLASFGLALEIQGNILGARKNGVSEPEIYQYTLQRLLNIVFTSSLFNSSSLGSNAKNVYTLEYARKLLAFLECDAYAAGADLAQLIVANTEARLAQEEADRVAYEERREVERAAAKAAPATRKTRR